MRRPGYLADWESDFQNYLKAKYPGWQPGHQVAYEVYTKERLPQPSEECPIDYLKHARHGCIPEADIIQMTLTS